MKAIDLTQEGSELSHKIRSVSDLIRHIETRETDSDTPNYNLFFGAGCSVTSGIRPAEALISEWINELYERFNSKKPLSSEDAYGYFESKHSKWFKKEEAYSSLFEKTYEFPPQRRRFVEKEVDGALPSIGYAYLSSLVDQRYFNTMFTTNFDDLLNEAFYQFSNERPLVCAHDSSIKSLSLTSKRPKIIKLHGDYLYDDIKSTLRETESLEQNTKEKLIEYCKEFGLIFVGYSGNDRSIMDVIDFLTKQDNFLKNGVYWCVRPSDEINPNLLSLFWRDKVYPVLIEGFDELFAEIHNRIIGKGVDIENRINNSKIKRMKESLISKKDLFKNSKYILDDIENLNEQNKRQEISNLISNITNDSKKEKISLNTLKKLLEIEDLMIRGNLSEAINLAKEYYSQTNENTDKTKFISIIIRISESLRDDQQTLYWCDKLLEIDPYNINFIIKKSNHIFDLETKYRFLKEGIKKTAKNHMLLNSAAECGLQLLNNKPKSNVSLENLLSLANESLKMNPSLTNYSWITTFNILIKLKENENTSIKANYDEQINIHVKKAEESNSDSIRTKKLTYRLAQHKNNTNKMLVLIDEIYDLQSRSSISAKKELNHLLDDVFSALDDKKKTKEVSEKIEYFFENHLKPCDLNGDSELLISKTRHQITKYSDLEEARLTFKSALDCNDIIENFGTAIRMNKCFDFEFTEDLLEILESKKNDLKDQYYYEYRCDLLVDIQDYNNALVYLEKAYSAGLSFTDYYMTYSYIKLLLREYEDVLNINSDIVNSLSSLECNEFLINLQYSAKQLSSPKFDDVLVRNLSAKNDDMNLKIAAFSLLDQENNVKRLITEKIKSSYLSYFTFKKWPVIDQRILEEAKNNVFHSKGCEPLASKSKH